MTPRRRREREAIRNQHGVDDYLLKLYPEVKTNWA